MNTFSKRLKELRRDRRLTQKELGKALFIDDTSISKYENEKAMPENELLQRIADYFGVSIDYLLGRSNETHILVDNENKNSNINLEEMIFDFEKGLENVIMKNGERLDERTKELFKQSLRNVYDFIAPEDKKY